MFNNWSRYLRLLWLAFFDKRTPLGAKLIVIFGVLYGVSPLDLIPDFIPLLGQLDDLGVILVALVFFLRATGKIRGGSERA